MRNLIGLGSSFGQAAETSGAQKRVGEPQMPHLLRESLARLSIICAAGNQPRLKRGKLAPMCTHGSPLDSALLRIFPGLAGRLVGYKLARGASRRPGFTFGPAKSRGYGSCRRGLGRGQCAYPARTRHRNRAMTRRPTPSTSKENP